MAQVKDAISCDSDSFEKTACKGIPHLRSQLHHVSPRVEKTYNSRPYQLMRNQPQAGGARYTLFKPSALFNSS